MGTKVAVNLGDWQILMARSDTWDLIGLEKVAQSHWDYAEGAAFSQTFAKHKEIFLT